MTDIRMADISEYQSSLDAPAYLKSAGQCIIIRSYNGSRPDNCMPSRRDYVRGQPFTGVGYYCYLKASPDPGDQARAFINGIGTLKANEWPILDHEEGSGDQTARAQKWFDVVDKWAGFPAMLYASTSFMRNQLSGCGHWGNRPLWLAAYPSSYSADPSKEPTDRHDLWQYTDRASMAGLSGAVDCSIAHVSAADFIKKMRAGQAPAPAPAPADTADEDMCVVVKADGRLEAFSQADNGVVTHKWQTATNGGWSDSWASLGNPGK